MDEKFSPVTELNLFVLRQEILWDVTTSIVVVRVVSWHFHFRCLERTSDVQHRLCQIVSVLFLGWDGLLFNFFLERDTWPSLSIGGAIIGPEDLARV